MTKCDYLPLDAKRCYVLADALGDTPETVISVHSLKRGLCKAVFILTTKERT